MRQHYLSTSKPLEEQKTSRFAGREVKRMVSDNGISEVPRLDSISTPSTYCTFNNFTGFWMCQTSSHLRALAPVVSFSHKVLPTDICTGNSSFLLQQLMFTQMLTNKSPLTELHKRENCIRHISFYFVFVISLENWLQSVWHVT